LTKAENSSVKGMFRLETSIDGKVLGSEDLTVDKTGVLRHAFNDRNYRRLTLPPVNLQPGEILRPGQSARALGAE
jgi:hypothetical protein